MTQDTGLKRNSVLFWLVALLASAFVIIGARFLYAPLDAAADFGVPVDGAQPLTYARAAGVRDIALGLLGFALLGLRVSRRVLAVFLAVVALIPLGDLINVYASVGASHAVALAIHAGTAVFMLILAAFLWKGAGERAPSCPS